MMSGGANATIVPNSPRLTELDRLAAEPRREDRGRSWSARRRAAGGRARPSRVSLPVSPCERLAHLRADAAEPLDVRAVRRFDQRQRAALRKRALGDDDDAELGAPAVALAQPLRDEARCRTESRESGSRRRRRPRRRRARSSRHSGPSPRRPGCAGALRPSCAADRSRRWRTRPRCRTRSSSSCRRCRCRSSWARRRSECRSWQNSCAMASVPSPPIATSASRPILWNISTTRSA